MFNNKALVSKLIIAELRKGGQLSPYDHQDTPRKLCDIRQHIETEDFRQFLAIVRNYATAMESKKLIHMMNAIKLYSPTFYAELLM